MKCAWWLSQGSTSKCTTWKGWGPGDGGAALVSLRERDGGCDALGKGDFKGGKDCKSMALVMPRRWLAFVRSVWPFETQMIIHSFAALPWPTSGTSLKWLVEFGRRRLALLTVASSSSCSPRNICWLTMMLFWGVCRRKSLSLIWSFRTASVFEAEDISGSLPAFSPIQPPWVSIVVEGYCLLACCDCLWVLVLSHGKQIMMGAGFVLWGLWSWMCVCETGSFLLAPCGRQCLWLYCVTGHFWQPKHFSAMPCTCCF